MRPSPTQKRLRNAAGMTALPQDLRGRAHEQGKKKARGKSTAAVDARLHKLRGPHCSSPKTLGHGILPLEQGALLSHGPVFATIPHS